MSRKYIRTNCNHFPVTTTSNAFSWEILLPKKAIYQNEMKKVTGCAISCDHTFRVSKNIGMARPGNNDKFVELFKNLFIILNEEGKVVDWQLTKTTGFKGVTGVFLQNKTHLQRANKKFELICVNDCCKVR